MHVTTVALALVVLGHRELEQDTLTLALFLLQKNEM